MTLHDEITKLADKWQHDLWPGRIQAIRELREILEQENPNDPGFEIRRALDRARRPADEDGLRDELSDALASMAEWRTLAERVIAENDALRAEHADIRRLLAAHPSAPNVSLHNDTISDERVTRE